MNIGHSRVIPPLVGWGLNPPKLSTFPYFSLCGLKKPCLIHLFSFIFIELYSCIILTHILLPWGPLKWRFLVFFQYNFFYNECYSFNNYHCTSYTFGGLRLSSHQNWSLLGHSTHGGWGPKTTQMKHFFVFICVE
jgi:hypothetical protein